jgi:hypothetical protein
VRADFAALFEQVEGRLPKGFLSSETLARIRALSRRLPSGLSSQGILECSLEREDGRADLQLCVDAKDGRDVLADAAAGERIDPALRAKAVWKRIRRAARLWRDTASPLYAAARNWWLEFDLPELEGPAPAPCVFIDTGGLRREKACVVEALGLLRGEPLRPGIAARLAAAFEELPDQAVVSYAADMLTRNVEAIRLIVKIRPGDLEGYLRRLGYPGPLSPLMRIVERFSCLARLRYNIDIADAPLPGVGLECFIAGGSACGWQSLLEELERRGLCLPSKTAALLGWPGHARTSDSVLLRRINHVKLSYRPGHPLACKGYLTFWKESCEALLLKIDPEAARLAGTLRRLGLLTDQPT